MNFPANLKYSKEHEWILVEGTKGTIGIGDTVAKDGVFGTVEAVKTVSDLFMPISGKVLEKNDALNDNPEAVNTDPYGKGWMVKVEITNPAELSGLMDVEAYKKHVGQ